MYKVLYVCITGSRMHGTYNKDSDTDTRVVYRDSLKERLSPFRGTTVQTDTDQDRSYYELSHFASMLAKCNPTAIELCHASEHGGKSILVGQMAIAAMDTEKYVSQCNGMIKGMLKKGTPKTLHHAARIHTHLTKYVESGIIEFYAPRYENYEYLMALKRGEVVFDTPMEFEKVEVGKIWHTQDKEKLETLVLAEYMEDVKYGFQSI